MNAVSNKLKALMVEHGITQRELAIKLDTSLTTVNKKINKPELFTLGQIKVLKELLGESVVDIFFSCKSSQMCKDDNPSKYSNTA